MKKDDHPELLHRTSSLPRVVVEVLSMTRLKTGGVGAVCALTHPPHPALQRSGFRATRRQFAGIRSNYLLWSEKRTLTC